MTEPFWSFDLAKLLPVLVVLTVGVVVVIVPVLIFKRAAWTVWWALVMGSALAVFAKTLDLLHWKLPSLWRQVAIAVALAIILAVVIGRNRPGLFYLRLCGLWPASGTSEGAVTAGFRRRVLVGALALVAAGFSLIVPKNPQWPSIVVLGFSGALFTWLVGEEVLGFMTHRINLAQPAAPSRDVLLTVALPWLILMVGSIVSMVTRKPSSASSVPVEHLLELFFVTAFGEELLFRGLLLGLALFPVTPRSLDGRTSRRELAFWSVSLAFGLWHIGDSILKGKHMGWSGGATVGLAVATVLVTTLASRLVLIPLRLRTGTLAAPFLAHFAANAPGIVAGG